jgi:hypothetical protein
MHMTDAGALLVVAALIAGRTAWAFFVSGSAANNDRGFTRDGSPLVFWITIVFGCVAAVACVSVSVWLKVRA